MAIGASRMYRGLADCLASETHTIVESGFVPNDQGYAKFESKVADVKDDDMV